jgi:stage III sporulation protein AD
MEIVKIVAIAIVCALLCTVLKQYKPEYAIVVQLAASVFILLLVVSAMGDLINAVRELVNGSGIDTEYLTLLLKALGVAVLTQLAADACRDSGETALSNKVELAGKVTILLLCLPLVKAMIQLSAGLIKG